MASKPKMRPINHSHHFKLYKHNAVYSSILQERGLLIDRTIYINIKLNISLVKKAISSLSL